MIPGSRAKVGTGALDLEQFSVDTLPGSGEDQFPHHHGVSAQGAALQGIGRNTRRFYTPQLTL